MTTEGRKNRARNLPQQSPGIGSTRVAIAVALLAFAFAFAIGLGYGSGNHRQYLIHGLHAIDADFLANDWFATQTPPVHPLFTHLIVLLDKLGPLNVVIGLVNGLFSAIFAVSLYFLIARFYDRPIMILAVVLLLHVLSPTNSLGWSYIIRSYFQPSTVGGVGLLAGLALLIHRRHLAASLVLAAAGFIHSGYLTWMIVLVTAFLIREWKHTVWRDRLALGISISLPLIYHAPLLFAFGSDPVAAEAASRVLQQIYVPQHFRPRTWGPTPFLQFGVILALGYLSYRWFRPSRPLNRPALVILAACLFIVALGCLFTLGIHVPFVATLFPYRLAPFLRLAAHVAIGAALVGCLVTDRRSWTQCAGYACLLAVGLFQTDVSETGLKYIVQLTIPVILYRLWLHPAVGSRRWTMPLRLAPAVAVVLIAVQFGRWGMSRKDTFGRDPSGPDRALYDWCRAETERTDVFVIPPELADFRLAAGRPVVVDWKCIPVVPRETLEWDRRLALICGRDFDDSIEARRGFDAMDLERARRIAREFKAQYIVTRSVIARSTLDRLPTVFANESVTVLDVRGEAPREALGSNLVQRR